MRFAGRIEELRASGVTGRDFVVEVKADAAALAEALGKRGAEAKVKSPMVLSVALAEGINPRDVFGVARAAGVQVRGLEAERESMEQAFLRVVGS